MNNSGKSDSSGRSQADRSRSQSQSNRGSTTRSCSKLSNSYHAYSYDDDVYHSKGITPSFYISKKLLVCIRNFKFCSIVFLFIMFGEINEQKQTPSPL